ncbi:DUF6366 family protein [Salisediminibacterium halotolerans]|uniref:DUF6366 family protein n=1 Tax=Salisediminibacterium halotolerans TaxID=517425 RepID=UPI000F290CC3|nr:DUF6366 family protein [Salisediminibacterium halotolerans]RLJ72272.1 hypothetical protein BCL39_2171 [Actinophytocola xinjiangensis]RPE85486.1 hypothetical protein EDD67_2306 [Salisediminibacterium halotolerans]TWG33441.1 hypothetical protein BCL52_2166 [Salisediminibacterium halotolerans]GEL07053.1 hypothetical protein SHA02_04690 [Salisediminibacterium halotolerans]
MNKETNERRQEKQRQQELKNNPVGTMSDSFQRASRGSLVDLVTSLGWKGMGIALLVMILALVVYAIIG